jgi:alkanesulfonate monooxygenase SsuD/methylene tetrahydromethanopterin reductase-like flavin-dependent oxidoreductase (luciferase family)
MGSVDFGVFLGLERPNYGSILDEALHCEELGYHSVWVADHVIGMYEAPGDSRFECWTTSTALLANTREIMVGQLVLCNPFRHPPLLAKMSATLDAISGGRLILGLGTGWHEGEFRSYGYPFDGNAARVRRLDEAAEIIKRMWTEESPSFKGKYYWIEKAWNSPKPTQRPHPPLMIAGGGEQLTLRTVARRADVSNFAAWTGRPEDFRAKNEALNAHCEKVGRRLKEIRRSWAAYCLIGGDAAESEMSLRSYTANMQKRYGASGGNRRPPLAGTPEQVADQIKRYVDSGVELFMIRFMGNDFKKEAKLFADEVMPQFK